MEIDSKVDKQVKRYLKRISNRIIESKTNESVHYFFDYEGDTCEIRFSGHFTPNRTLSKIYIDIVKCTRDLYRVNIDTLQFMVKEEQLLNYVKSLLVCLPEFYKSLSSVHRSLSLLRKNHSAMAKAHNKEVSKLNKTIEKLRKDDWISTALCLESELADVTNKLADANKEIVRLTARNNVLEAKIKSLTVIATKMTNVINN